VRDTQTHRHRHTHTHTHTHNTHTRVWRVSCLCRLTLPQRGVTGLMLQRHKRRKIGKRKEREREREMNTKGFGTSRQTKRRWRESEKDTQT